MLFRSDCKEIKSVHPKGNQPWRFIRRTDADSEALILRPPDRKSRLTGKDPDAGKDGRQKEKGAAEDERVRQCHRLDKHAFEQTPGDSEGQGGLQNARHDLATEQRITIRHLRVVIDTAVLETHLVQPVFQELHAAFSTGFPETQTQTYTHRRSCFRVNEKLYWPRATEIY